MHKNQLRFLFAGGGTGGHLFPAIAVAEKIRVLQPDADILFVGTKSRIEGTVVPKLGFKFRAIWIKGFSRKLTIDNLFFPIKLVVSLFQSLIINFKFKPDVSIGTGGYVAGPAIWASSIWGAKIILIEQNSFPGVTTKLLQKYADEIHISYNDSKKYLKNHTKLYLTGNPVRENLIRKNKQQSLAKFGFNNDWKTLLVLGGSLGAASINSAVAANIIDLNEKKIQLIWQTGKIHYDSYKSLSSERVWISPFIENMNDAYSACDLLLARAGATTISEILFLGIPSVLVPSPNVAENHQYYNAKSLAEKGAAIMLEDRFIAEKFMSTIDGLITDENLLTQLSNFSIKESKPQATMMIAQRAIAYAKREVIN